MGSFIGNQPLTQAQRLPIDHNVVDGQSVYQVNYTPGFIDVIVNGSTLQKEDYTATNGTSITLNTPTVTGDSLSTVAWGTFVSAVTNILDNSVSLNKIQTPPADPVPNWAGRVLTGAELTAINIIGTNPEATLWPDGSVTGSSDNGQFTKYPNGNLECRATDPTILTTNEVVGNIFRPAGGASTTFTYPIVFFGTPPQVSPGLGGNAINTWARAARTSETLSDVIISVFGAVSGSSGNIVYVANGRWK